SGARYGPRRPAGCDAGARRLGVGWAIPSADDPRAAAGQLRSGLTAAN
ncbi:hypothetical protein ABLN97_16820, partial [Mycobacterium tuberculosis]